MAQPFASPLPLLLDRLCRFFCILYWSLLVSAGIFLPFLVSTVVYWVLLSSRALFMCKALFCAQVIAQLFGFPLLLDRLCQTLLFSAGFCHYPLVFSGPLLSLVLTTVLLRNFRAPYACKAQFSVAVMAEPFCFPLMLLLWVNRLCQSLVFSTGLYWSLLVFACLYWYLLAFSSLQCCIWFWLAQGPFLRARLSSELRSWLKRSAFLLCCCSIGSASLCCSLPVFASLYRYLLVFFGLCCVLLSFAWLSGPLYVQGCACFCFSLLVFATLCSYLLACSGLCSVALGFAWLHGSFYVQGSVLSSDHG